MPRVRDGLEIMTLTPAILILAHLAVIVFVALAVQLAFTIPAAMSSISRANSIRKSNRATRGILTNMEGARHD